MTRTKLYSELFNRYNRERRQFFLDCREESGRQNLRMLKKITILLVPFILFEFFFTPFLVRGWTISLPYYVLFGFVVLTAGISIFYASRPKIHYHVANTICTLFILGMFIITAWIDIFPYRNVPASFVPLLLIVTPTVFVLRFRLIIPLMAIVDLVYSIVALWYKVPRIAQSDVFTAFIGLVLGYMMTLTIVQLRIRDNNAKREYQRRCMVDPVTGILNKFSFENSLRDTLNARDETHECALLLVDIDNMKRMNDELGKLVGDMFLENVAEFLTSIFRGSDIIGRVGGDEFMVYVRNLKSEDWLAGKCSRIQHEIKAISNENGNINMTCSIGAAVAGKVPVSFEQMYTQADDSLYKAKTRGRGKYVLHYVHKEREVIH